MRYIIIFDCMVEDFYNHTFNLLYVHHNFFNLHIARKIPQAIINYSPLNWKRAKFRSQLHVFFTYTIHTLWTSSIILFPESTQTQQFHTQTARRNHQPLVIGQQQRAAETAVEAIRRHHYNKCLVVLRIKFRKRK